jgi:diguanylate cyclase (GGDEF)-like protein/PAS domain S-box-containing protein
LDGPIEPDPKRLTEPTIDELPVCRWHRDRAIALNECDNLSVSPSLTVVKRTGRVDIVAVEGAVGSQATLVSERATPAVGAYDASSEMYELAFRHSATALAVVSASGAIADANVAFCALVRFDRYDLLAPRGADLLVATTDDGTALDLRDIVEVPRVVRWTRGDGTSVRAELTSAPIYVPGATATFLALSVREIPEEKELAQLTFQAFHDPLTGLANRMLFGDRLDHALARASRSDGGGGAVLLLDLDDFKGVNDSLGHAVGDELLVELARRLTEMTRTSDTLCRLGGDEFLILLEDVLDEREIEAIAERIVRSFATPIELAGSPVLQQASLGIATWFGGDEDPAALIAHADVAMYEAKRLGKGRYVTYHPDLDSRAVEHAQLEKELIGAIGTDQLSMYFQPIIDLVTGRVEGFEALMRWTHPTRGSIVPMEFLSVADSSGLIEQLSELALRESTRRALGWTGLGGDHAPYVSINLSAREFYDAHLVRSVESALTRSGLPASRLVLEVSETVALADVEAAGQTMQRLAQHGIRIAIDDFGTGYTSLSHQSLTYPRIIKIHESLLRGCAVDTERRTLLEGIASLGRSFGARLVGEGIETSSELDLAREVGCEAAQGFLFAPPVAASEVVATARRIEAELQLAPTARARAALAAGASGLEFDHGRH